MPGTTHITVSFGAIITNLPITMATYMILKILGLLYIGLVMANYDVLDDSAAHFRMQSLILNVTRQDGDRWRGSVTFRRLTCVKSVRLPLLPRQIDREYVKLTPDSIA